MNSYLISSLQIESLEKSIEQLLQTMAVAEKNEKESTTHAQNLEHQLKDAGNIRERQLNEAKSELEKLKKKAENSRKEWEKRKQEAEVLKLEIEELQKSIVAGKEQLVASEEKLNVVEEKVTVLEQELNEVKANVKRIQSSIKEQKDIINKQNVYMQKLMIRKEDIIKQSKEAELDIKKLNHEINSIKNIATDCKEKVAELTRKYEWIEENKIYFGKAGNFFLHFNYILHLFSIFK